MGEARRLLIGAACALALAACSGATDGFGSVPDGAAAPDGPATPASPGARPTAPLVTGSAPDDAPVPASLTTADPAESTAVVPFEDEIRADLAEIDANLVACLGAPATCDASTVAVPGSRAHRWLADDARQYAADGVLVREGDGLHTVLESAIEREPGRTAAIVVCATNGLWLVDPTTTGGDGDIVIDDATNSRRQEWTVEMTADGWRRVDLTTIEMFYGTDRCAAQ